MSGTLVQVEVEDILEQNDTAQPTSVCWIEHGLGIRVGTILEFKNFPGLWKITKVYETKIFSYDINRKWHVGGL